MGTAKLTALLKRTLRRHQTGQAIIILAIGFVALIGFVGIVTDVSLMFVRYAALRRAVDSAAVAAAGQVRGDRENVLTSANLAAQQFLEFHGIDPDAMRVSLCRADVQPFWADMTDADIDAEVASLYADPNSEDAERYRNEWEKNREISQAICDADRKLVWVTAQIESPTVFLSILGQGAVTLEASAVSETAALDVVVVMDVSESMLDETTYDTWDEELGRNFSRWLPARLNTAWYKYRNDIRLGLQPNGTYYNKDTNFVDVQGFRREFLSKYSQNMVKFNTPGSTITIDGRAFSFYPAEYWMDGDVPKLAITDAADIPEMTLADPNEIRTPTTTLTQMRTDCRIRLHPVPVNVPRNDAALDDLDFELGHYISLTTQADKFDVDMDDNRTEQLSVWDSDGIFTGAGLYTYDVFQPGYNFYGCCNDPTAGATVDSDGNIDVSSANFDDFDWNFSDLVCQPFKGARDATRDFLGAIDFIRGDRLAFVTFDRRAYLVDPDGNEAFGGGPKTHMIDDSAVAERVLNELIGVRAEPSFYHTDHLSGLDFEANPQEIDRWDDYSWGIDVVAADVDDDGVIRDGEGFERGASMMDNLGSYDNQAIGYYYGVGDTSGYLAASSCPFFAAGRSNFFSLWARYPATVGNPQPAVPLYDIMNPPVNTVPAWYDHYADELGFVDGDGNPTTNNWAQRSYEYWASCRGTNIGAALREANNALLNPQTIRQEGTVWVIVFLGDGAAGASDPVATTLGADINTADPYRRGPDGGPYDYDPLNPSGPNPIPGNYGSFGFCPYGEPDNPRRYAASSDYPSFPFCMDLDPTTRQSCNTDEDGDSWQKTTADEIEGVVYQALSGSAAASPSGSWLGCDRTYDVDDYARDWADFVAMERPGENAQLPAIFTIGFGLTYDATPQEDQTVCEANAADCLGEELLRYIADVGDNNRFDDDYPTAVGGSTRESYGNYYSAPSRDELDDVFNEIAGKLFTRIAQ